MEITAKIQRGRKTKDLVKRLRPGEIAVIDHRDMDHMSAESLLESGVVAVVNASPSISGLYPNAGPLVLVRGGVTLLDECGQVVFEDTHDGDTVTIDTDAGTLTRKGKVIATGVHLTQPMIEAALDEASENIGERLDEFARNTVEYLEREKDILASETWVPKTRTLLYGRHVLVVVRGYHFKEDLQTLKPYIREMKPVLIGVDGGADALREAGFKPDIIIGDMDSVNDDTLRGGAELIVAAYEDGRCPGMERLKRLGLADEATTWPLAATSEDLALILAWEMGADLIVAVGTHANLIEYLDKGRKGMASSFLVRLKVGSRLVDAKGVNRLYRSSVSAGKVFPLVLAAVAVIGVLIFISPSARNLFMLSVTRIRLLLGIY
ncbi:MAG: putative cytokinetic ring protein SteA [Coriobacteriia bacterium]|nr:putative cytokinetic ring protein SteA [Coriobacteriia bacterium]